MRREAVVVVAAGVGRRLDASKARPKALVTVGGRPLLDLALEGLRAADVADVVVVHTPGHAADFADVCRRQGVTALVPGGATRTASVRAGLGAVAADTEVVAIHDAARALTPAPVVRAVLDAVVGDVVAAAPAVAVADTLKRAEDGRVVATLDRAGVHAVQTPQAFVPAVLRRALAAGVEATDDLALVERAIADGTVAGEVRLVPGSAWGLKVTYPEDLVLAAALLVARREASR